MMDARSVGGKSAALGEMISQLAQASVGMPGGFATTADAFRDLLLRGCDPHLGVAQDGDDVTH